MSRSLFASVAVNIPQLSGCYDYSIPDETLELVKIGSLVTVPFGKQLVQGIVVSLPENPSVSEPKPLASILEIEPVVTQSQIELARWMASENLSNLSACLELMLPPGLSQHADILIQLVKHESPDDLTVVQSRILNLLLKRGDLRGSQIDRSLSHMDWRKSLQGLVKRGVVQTRSILQPPQVKAKTVRTARLLRLPSDELDLGKTGSAVKERRQKIINLLQQEGDEVSITYLYAETGGNAGDLTFLTNHGFVQLTESEVQRDPLVGLNPAPGIAPELTAEQNLVVTSLKGQLNGSVPIQPNLLQGVTGSGKTEVYLKAVEETLRLQKQAVILVPEISLTPQTVSRFLARFPGQVGLVHSRLSPGERYDTWRRIRAGELPVVVGARSAFFAPLRKLGLIVIDECHDGSYHQEDFDPHYQVISAALEYARISGAVALMGSATPEIELLHLFRQRKWNIFHLPERVLAHRDVHPVASARPGEGLPMPEIEVVDMRAELVAGNRSPLSRALQQGLAKVLDDHAQAILFLNRRGSSTYVFCRDCGHVLKCSRCETTLTYHENQGQLVCHRCNTQRRMPEKCPQCGSARIKQFGLGTESLQKIVAEQFPQARILRWDADTARTKGSHDLIMEHFAHHRADILIGTQMIAKGLDLPDVTLVGVVLADVSLNLPDFRAAERTFQLLTQVAGRSGRSALGGRVVLQTYKPDHYAIQKAAAYDFSGFEKLELEYRRQTGYPPFAKLIKIEFSHANPTLAANAARETGDLILSWIRAAGLDESNIIGPAPCFFQKRAGVYRWQIILRGPDPLRILQNHPLAEWQPAGVRVGITVDPINLL